MKKRLVDKIAKSRVWGSIVRHGYPDTNRNRALLVFSNLFLHLHPVKARVRAFAFRTTFYLGGLSAACFLLLVVSGALLMFYYRPASAHAYDDMKDIEFVVFTGMFQRNIHRWAAHTMVALVFVHMAVTFYRKAYRSPREFNWLIGVGLFVGTVLLSYTGYLLPWDQLAYWAVTVGVNMGGATPFIGDDIRRLLLGGNAIGDATIVRFYVLHCVVLPLVVLVGIALHIWRIRKDGGLHLPPMARTDATPETTDATHRSAKDDAEPMAMTYPHLLLREGIAFVAITLGLSLWSMLADAPLEQLANPERTPNPAKAPWYFLGLQELLHYYAPAISGVFLPLLMLVALAIIPYFDVNSERLPLWRQDRPRRFAALWAAVGIGTAVLWWSGAHPVFPMMGPLWGVGVLMSAGAFLRPSHRWLRALTERSLPFWIFTWFLIVAVTLTIVGIFFRGPGWTFVLPWRDGLYL